MTDSQVGVMPAPDGETATFGGGLTSLQITLLVVNFVTYALATIFLFLRLYTSVFLNKKTDTGDFLIVASWGVGAGSIACTAIAIHYGYGDHAWNVTMTEIMGYYNKLVAMSVTYFWTPSLTKLSVLALIHHLYRAKWGRICAWMIAAAILVYTVLFTALVIGPCNPLGGSIQCLNNVGSAHAALNIATDLVVIGLPIPLVHTLQMPMRQKISVGVLMALGSFCVVASIGRIVFVVAIHDNPDVTFFEAKVGVWSALELNIGIMGASLARLKPFVQKYFPKLPFSAGASSTPNFKGRVGYEDKSQRPSHGSYLLHSIQRASTHASEGPEDHGEISIQSDRYVLRSKGDLITTNVDSTWVEKPDPTAWK